MFLVSTLIATTFLLVSSKGSFLQKKMLFDFNSTADINSWKTVNDVVMGGVSTSQVVIDADGHGKFSGNVSTANNGGFASVRHQLNTLDISGHSTVKIRLKGDGKNYQFRIKKNSSDYYSYITTFPTSGSWQTISIPLKEMYPSFRGRKLNMPNFKSTSLEEIAFLIANKKNEPFELLIDKIEII